MKLRPSAANCQVLTANDLLQLHQHAVSACRVDEGDQRSMRAWPRRLVNQANAFLLQPREDGAEIIDAECKVVDARATLRDIGRDRRILRGRFEQLEGGLAHLDEVRADALRRNLFRRLDLEPERISVKGQRLGEVFDRYPNVIQRCFHAFL